MTEDTPEACGCLTCALWQAAKEWFEAGGVPEGEVDIPALMSSIGDMAGEVMAHARCGNEAQAQFEMLLGAIQKRLNEDGQNFQFEKHEVPTASQMN